MTNENKVQAYKLTLWVGIPISLVGIILRMNHNILGELLLSVSGTGALLIFVLGLMDVLADKSTKTTVKVMWVFGFLSLSYLTGLIYFKNYKQHQLPLS